MPFLDEHGLDTVWTNAKNWFAKWVDVTSSENQVTISLKSGWSTKTDSHIEVLDSANIPVATTTSAGVMSKEDKSKLDGVAVGATANVGTITGIQSNAPISGSGTSGSITISHSDSGVTEGSYGPEAGQSALEPSFGGTIDVPGYTVNAKGHITNARERSVKIPNSVATTGASGLMSAADKTKLNGIEEGATANIGTITGITSTGPILGSGTSGSVALSHDVSGVTAGTYGDTATTALTPTWGGTFNVPGASVNATGHVTSAGSHTVKIPENIATVDAKGLMSSDDKAKLNGIETGANKTTVDSSLSSTSTNPVQNKKVNEALNLKAPLASPALTGTPTAPTAVNGTNTTQIATTAFVQNAFQANDAMVFKGTIGSSGATVTALPATHYQGWTYKVITAGSYAGQQCEIGDMIICVTDGTSANNDHWTVVQSNVDGIVTGPASSTDANVAVFNGATGKVIKDSGFTIGKSVPSNAVFTDTDTKVTAVDNHYAPAENASSALNASGATGTAGSTVQVVTGIKRDAKGHVTGIVSGAATDTDTKVTSAANHYAPAKDSSSTLTASGATGTSGSTVQVVTGIERDAKGHVTGIVSGAATDTNQVYYGTCNTGSSVAEKAVTCTDYTLKTGNIIAILFTTASSVGFPTLNINSTGAKSIKINNQTTTNSRPCKWQSNQILYFVYDGDSYEYLGRSSTSNFGNTHVGSCNTVASSSSKSISDLSEMGIFRGQMFSIIFSEGNSADAVTLSLNSTSLSVYYKGSATSASNKFTWDANDIVTFIISAADSTFVANVVCKSSSDAGVVEVIPALETEIASQLPSGATGEYGIIYDVSNSEISIESIEALEPIPVESVLNPGSSNIPTSQAVAMYISTISPNTISNETIDVICI